MMLCIMNTCCYLLASIIMLDIPQQITLHLENVQRKREKINVWTSSFVCDKACNVV